MKYIYIETDHHANNTWGLLRPGTTVKALTPHGHTYDKEFPLNPEQMFLWAVREEAVKGVKKIVGDNPITYIHLGDYIQGTKHATDRVTDSPYEEQVIAQGNLSWLAQELNLERIRLVLGTEAHDGVRHESIKSLLSALSGYCPDIEMTWHGLLEVEGMSIDFSHHGPGDGKRDWLKGNEMRYYTKSLMAEDMKRGNEPPRLILRGHRHGYHWETVRERINNQWYTSDYVMVPSLCGLGAYGKKVTQSEHLISNGAILVAIQDEMFHVHEWVVERDLRKKEVI